MIEPILTWYFPSNWTASQVLEWARLRNLVLNKSDLTLYRGWNGRQFWFTLAWPMFAFPYVWRVRTRLPERFGQFCTVLIRAGRMNSALVMFSDFEKVVTSRWYIRKRKPELWIV